MARTRTGELIVGLDIGTTKVCAVVGEMTDGGIDIVGIGSHPSTGLRKGVVVNIESTVASIQEAIEEAERMAGCEITTVYTGIAGGHIGSQSSDGVISIKDGEVSEADIQRVIESAKAINMPLDREVIHVLPNEFIIDGQGGIKNPLGMSGVRLQVKVHIVTGAISSAQNIIKCANRTGLNVADIVLQPLASSEACLTEEERELGVCLVDIGGGTTDVAIYSGGAIVHTSVIALGGNNLTNDIAMGLRTPQAEAEAIKQKHGCALPSLIGKDEQIEVTGIGGRPTRTVPRSILCEILEPRVEELFQLIHREIQTSGHQELLASGVVITGGSSILPGIPEIAEEVIGLPTRRGAPCGVGGLIDVVRSPIYATGVGLVMYGARNLQRPKQFRVRGKESSYKSVWDRMRAWFGEVF